MINPPYHEHSILHHFAAIASQSPDTIAAENKREKITYRELDDASSRFAARLKQHGVQQGQPVPVVSSLCIAFLVGILGVLKAGGVYVPVDRSQWSDEHISGVLRAVKGGVLVVDSSEDRRWEGYGVVVAVDEEEKRKGSDTAEEQVVVEKKDEKQDAEQGAACIIFTSGTTGKPKGVLIRHEALANLVVTRRSDVRLGAGDRFLMILSPAFDACNGYIFSVLCSGGTLVLATACNLQARLRTCNILAATPSILESLGPPSSRIHGSHSCCSDEYPSLKTIVLGGETPSQQLLRAWASPTRTIYNDYGPTEATCAVLTGTIEFSKSSDSFKNSIVGAPISGTQVFLLDDTLHEISALGQVGEITIAGVCLAAGYWQDEAMTREKFTVWQGTRVYRTGDYGRWQVSSTGRKVIEFRGRRDRLVKNRGFLVNLETDVDTAILDVGQPFVTGAFSLLYAGRLYAVVTPHTLEVDVLRARLVDRLLAYQVPDRIIAVDALPTGANGKIHRRGVQTMVQEKEGQEEDEEEMNTAAGCATVEGIVRAGMARVLGLPVAAIRRDSAFLKLGGHSLAAVAVASYCRQRGTKVTAYDILTSHTVGELFARCSGVRGPCRGFESVTVSSKTDTGPITDVQLSFIYGSQCLRGVNVIQATTVYPSEVIPALRKAWEAVIKAEPIFRTTFDVERRLQVVNAEATPFRWEEVVVATEDAYERESRNAPFDIGLATTFKVVSWNQQSALIWTIHHALIDGYSASLILNKVQDAAANNRGPVKPGPSFAQLAHELELLQKTSGEEAKAFWKQQEEELPEATCQLRLPRPTVKEAVDLVAPPTPQFADFTLATNLSLKSITQSMVTLGATPPVLFYAAWAILLSNYCNCEQVLIGAVLSGRNLPLPLAEAAIGPLVNTLPLRILVDPGSTAADFLRAVFLKLHRIARFQWSFPANERRSYHSVLATQYDMPKLNYEFAAPIKKPTIRERADIPLSVLIEEDMSVRFLYHSYHYNELDIQRLAKNYRNILHALLEPGATVETCSRKMLSPEDRHALYLYGNALSPSTFATESSETVVTMFEEMASRHSLHTAVEKGTNSLTYQELDAASTRLARSISRLAQVGDVVCLHADHSINWIIGIISIFKAGMTYCPLDKVQPPEVRSDIYARSGATLFLAPSHRQLKYAPKAASRSLGIDSALQIDDDDDAGNGWCRKGALADPKSIAYICFTSGSTGKPKGVLCEHGGLTEFQKSWRKLFPSAIGRRWAQFLSAGFDGSIFETFSALCHGSTLVLRDSDDPFAVLRIADQAMITPSTAEGLAPCDFPNLKWVYIGGEPLSHKVVDRWAPGRSLYNIYGPTEGTILTTAKRLHPGSSITIGFPLPSMRVYILNYKMGFVPVGVVGEIFIAGVQVARGYVGMEEETKRKFIPDTVCPRESERMYRTGDLGYWTEEGEVMCVGRKDRQIKLRGFRVDLGSVESTIVREGTNVKAAAVTMSQGSLIAWVQPACVDTDSLAKKLKSVLPPYARPKTITAVDSFPLSKTGKLDYAAIASMPRPLKRKWKGGSLSGRTETIIAQEWHRLLELEESDTLSSDDSFVELGGHSVLQLILAARLSKLFGPSIPVSVVINSHSLRDLASAIDALRQSDNGVRRMAGRQLGYHDLSPTEMEWWLKYRTAEAKSTFNVPFACKLSSSVDRKLLARAWNAVISRHNLLRCRFIEVEGEPRRIFSDVPPVARLVESLDVWSEVNRPIDLANEDLIRVLISPRHLTVTITHIICDLLTLHVLLKEVAAVYACSALPEVRTTYMEISQWSHHASPSDLKFWSTYLEGIPLSTEATAALSHHPHSGIKSYRGTSRVFDVGQALYRKVTTLAKRYNTTVHQISRAAVVLTLQALTGADDVVIGSPFMNRPRLEDQEVVGLFLEPLPMRFRLDREDMSCESVVQTVQCSSQSALAHAVPWNDLLEHLGIQRGATAPSTLPIFDTVVTFHEKASAPGWGVFPVPGADPLMVWTEGSKFKLLFEWTTLASTENLVVRLEYDTDRISAACIGIVEEALRTSLNCLASDMSCGEIVREIAGTSRDFCRARCVDAGCLDALVYGA